MKPTDKVILAFMTLKSEFPQCDLNIGQGRAFKKLDEELEKLVERLDSQKKRDVLYDKTFDVVSDALLAEKKKREEYQNILLTLGKAIEQAKKDSEET